MHRINSKLNVKPLKPLPIEPLEKTLRAVSNKNML